MAASRLRRRATLVAALLALDVAGLRARRLGLERRRAAEVALHLAHLTERVHLDAEVVRARVVGEVRDLGLDVELERALALELLFALPRLRLLLFFLARRFGAGGTLPPFSRASLKPMAIACFRLRTLPPEPLRSVPFFCRRTADSTLFDAAFPYFAIAHLLGPSPPGSVTPRSRAAAA